MGGSVCSMTRFTTVGPVLAISVCFCTATFDEKVMRNPDEVVPQETNLISTRSEHASKGYHSHSHDFSHDITRQFNDAKHQVQRGNTVQNDATKKILHAVDKMAGTVRKAVHKAHKHERKAIRKAKKQAKGKPRGK